ncbi:MAG TPA: hypothetical protein VFO19_16375 [Vicinamibacterales bacterium]|nr:hypothetical protein [Vicinamibacterales bacterium]
MKAASTLAPRLAAAGIPGRIWERDAEIFAGPSPTAERLQSIRHRLGWLEAPDMATTWLDELHAFIWEIREAQLTDVYLLGMGGSSLCAEVFRDVPTARAGGTTLTVLDTTDERAIRHATEGLTPRQSLFIVASKSGSTIEVASLERHFWEQMKAAVGDDAGGHFVAITDPETSLGTLASKRGYRKIFINPEDIGGRYSALSFFGLVPAALLGLELEVIIASAQKMAGRCHANDEMNPGLALGAFMANEALAGRDKLTLLLSPAYEAFGPWIEQLVAESTGKIGRGVLPIVGEPIGRAGDYEHDRAFVVVLSTYAPGLANAIHELQAAGHPVFQIEATPADLGGEFFRWEFATAVAGHALGVNPFDEPNVREAKERTQAQLDARKARGAFRLEPPFDKGQGYSRREHRSEAAPAPPPERRRYVAILDYLPRDPRRADVVAKLRAALRRRARLATTYGIGPRYLHSTGQYHKGGPNTGVFLLMTAVDESATPVPGTEYTFSTLKMAQALGDFEALSAAGREVVHYHLEDPATDYTEALERVLRSFK